LLVACAFFILVNFTNALLHNDAIHWRRGAKFMSWWAIVASYEATMLWITIRAQRRNRPVRSWVWVVNILIECSFPTLALMGLSADKSFLGPYRALHSPAMLTYCMLIILSTLRLSPALSILSGIVCAVGFVLAFIFNALIAPDNPARRELPPESWYLFPVFLYFCGVAAGGVARQIRAHVLAALAEAETRRKLDRVEHELRTARSIQMGLLPQRPPNVPGYDIAGFSEPADQTGGDYYDWIELPGGSVLFTIADATGHGIGPALLVAACRAYFRAVAVHADPLERIAAQVDALLAADIPAGRFITAAIALLDPRAHRIGFYSAGHAPTYLYLAATNAMTTLDADQPPLGTQFGDGGSQARVIEMAPGDAFVLVTDGFFECRDGAGALRGIDALAESIRKNQALPAEQLVRRLYQEAIDYSQGTPQADDLTVVVIKRAPAVTPAADRVPSAAQS
jgi:serine phosphatase RsbU (regulator of sigma subunit)